MRPVILLFFILVLPGAASALFHLLDIRIEIERLLGGVPPPAPRVAIRQLPPQPPEWDDAAYLAANPDVAAAVRNGGFHNGYEHYALLGAQEGRAPAFRKSKRRTPPPPEWNDDAYLAANPDVAAAVRDGGFHNGYEHYALYGAQENRPLAIREADRRPPPQAAPAPAPAPAPPVSPLAISPLAISPPAPPAKQEPKTEPAPIQAPAAAAPPPPVKPAPPVKTATETPKADPPKPEAAQNPAKSGGGVDQVRFGRHPGFVRMVLNADAAATHALSADRKTLHVDFPPGAAWRAPTQGDGGGPLLTGYQARDLGAGGKRLSVTARQPIKVMRFMILPADERQGRRLVWDLAPD